MIDDDCVDYIVGFDNRLGKDMCMFCDILCKIFFNSFIDF